MATVLVTFAVAAAYGASGGGSENHARFKVGLAGESERPSAVDTAASAKAHVHIKTNDDGGVEWLIVHVVVCNIENATAAHIHAPAGPDETAPVVLTLYSGDPFSTDECAMLSHFKLSGAALEENLTNIDLAGFLDAIASGQAYINVHTQAHPAGEVRGQLV